MSTLEEKARHVADVLNKDHVKQAVKITATPAEQPLPQTASKFGGVPYQPLWGSAPTNAAGQPLGMIAQINCDDLPKNDLYPKTGILQFWIDPHDANWGYDASAPSTEGNWRVIYYENVVASDSNTAVPEVNRMEHWPIQPSDVEFSLSFEVIEQGITGTAHYYYDDFARTWNELYPERQIEGYREAQDIALPIEENDEFSKLGGYPYFVQSDPRFFEESIQGHTVNLLTIVSEDDSQIVPKLLWGGAGAANWLITPEQLAAKDFSHVVFEWSS